MAGSAPGAFSHATDHIHAAETSGDQPDHGTGRPAGELTPTSCTRVVFPCVCLHYINESECYTETGTAKAEQRLRAGPPRFSLAFPSDPERGVRELPV